MGWCTTGVHVCHQFRPRKSIETVECGDNHHTRAQSNETINRWGHICYRWAPMNGKCAMQSSLIELIEMGMHEKKNKFYQWDKMRRAQKGMPFGHTSSSVSSRKGKWSESREKKSQEWLWQRLSWKLVPAPSKTDKNSARISIRAEHNENNAQFEW